MIVVEGIVEVDNEIPESIEAVLESILGELFEMLKKKCVLQ